MMVEIEFSVTPEDYATFNKQFFKFTNPKTRIFMRVFFLALILVVGYLLRTKPIELTDTERLTLLPMLAILGYMAYVLSRYNITNTHPKRILKGYEGWEDTVFNLPTTLRIETDHLFVASKFTESRMKWPVFRKAYYAEDYAAIYSGPTVDVYIPRDGITRGDFDAFTAELQKHIHPTLD